MNRANRAPAARSAPRRFFNHFNGSRGAFIIRDGWRRSRFSPARPPRRAPWAGDANFSSCRESYRRSVNDFTLVPVTRRSPLPLPLSPDRVSPHSRESEAASRLFSLVPPPYRPLVGKSAPLPEGKPLSPDDRRGIPLPSDRGGKGRRRVVGSQRSFSFSLGDTWTRYLNALVAIVNARSARCAAREIDHEEDERSFLRCGGPRGIPPGARGDT